MGMNNITKTKKVLENIAGNHDSISSRHSTNSSSSSHTAADENYEIM